MGTLDANDRGERRMGGGYFTARACSLYARVSMCMLEGDWWQHIEHVGLYFQQISSFSLVEPAQQQEETQHNPSEIVRKYLNP